MTSINFDRNVLCLHAVDLQQHQRIYKNEGFPSVQNALISNYGRIGCILREYFFSSRCPRSSCETHIAQVPRQAVIGSRRVICGKVARGYLAPAENKCLAHSFNLYFPLPILPLSDLPSPSPSRFIAFLAVSLRWNNRNTIGIPVASERPQ